MRLWNAVKRLAVELWRLGKATIKQIGRRRMIYAFATAAAAVFIAAVVFDASSADMGLNGRPTVQRASGWAW